MESYEEEDLERLEVRCGDTDCDMYGEMPQCYVSQGFKYCDMAERNWYVGSMIKN